MSGDWRLHLDPVNRYSCLLLLHILCSTSRSSKSVSWQLVSTSETGALRKSKKGESSHLTCWEKKLTINQISAQVRYLRGNIEP